MPDAPQPKSEDPQIPCLGCGRKDGLTSPVKDCPEAVWCMRCGTFMDTGDRPVNALIPQLCMHTLYAFGHPVQLHIPQQLAPDDPASGAPPPAQTGS